MWGDKVKETSKKKNYSTTDNALQFVIDGCLVKLNFASEPDEHVLEDIKYMILNVLEWFGSHLC